MDGERKVNDEREWLLNLILAHFCDVFISLDASGRVLETRGSIEEIFQRTPDDLTGQIIWEVFPQLKGGDLYQETQSAVQRNLPLHISGQLLPWEGWIEALINPIPSGVELLVRNISTYQQEQDGGASAEKSKVLFEALLKNIPEGILIADAADTSNLVLSRHGEETLGIPKEEILQQPFRSLLEKVTFLQPDGLTPVAYQDHPLIRALEKGDSAEDDEMVLRNARNEVFPVSCKYGPIHNENGDIIAGIFSWMNINERKKAARELEETARRLANSNRALETFAYSASHDLQEPLRKIIGFSDLIGQTYRSSLDDDGQDLLERMRNASLRMQKVIESLLSFSRISAQPPVLSHVDLNRVLRNVISDLEFRIQTTGARVQVDPLPSVSADPALMGNLFLNLVGNALKFHRPGVAPEVRIYQESTDLQEGGWMRIAVEDNGIGFDLENADRIFQPFQRLHGRSEYEGSGLGLAISKMIVEQHGGQITAQSKPGHGSIFLIDLPAS